MTTTTRVGEVRASWRARLVVVSVAALVGSLAAVASAGPASASSTIHVDIAASGFNDGTSWTNAFTDLQDALAVAGAGDEIRVAKGTYRPHGTDRAVSFDLVDGVVMTGGYQTGGTAGPNPAAYSTILSGDLAADDLAGFVNNGENSYHVVTSTSVSAASVLDGFTVTAGNANGSGALETFGGGIFNGFGSSPSITNTSISNNTATDSGGAIYNSFSSSPSISNTTIANNTATSGGGIYSVVSSLSITGTTISNNTASQDGGGIYNNTSSPAIIGTTISNNTAASAGGGIYNNTSSAAITDTTISNNTAASAGGGIYDSGGSGSITDTTISDNTAVSGGGIYNTSSSPAITDTTISNNTASQDGGGIHNESNSSPAITGTTISNNTAASAGGGIYNTSSSPAITDTTISNNTASQDGGGIHNESNSSPAITGTSISDNTASQDGGGIHNESNSSPSITGTTISNNTAASAGGGIFNNGGSGSITDTTIANNTANSGGGVYNNASSPSITDTTIANNTAASGGGIFNNASSPSITDTTIIYNTANSGGGIFSFSSSGSITGSTIANNTANSGGGIYNPFSSAMTVANSVVWANTPGDGIVDNGAVVSSVSFSDVEGWVGGVGNIDVDPLFVGPGDFRLLPASPARNVGDNAAVVSATDFDGRPRIQGGTVDMGAFETPVPFDDFAAAGVLSGASGSVSVSNVGATAEAGEPAADCPGAGVVAPVNSIWFSWTAPNSARVQFDTIGSPLNDTYLHAYTGASLGSLIKVACNDDEPGVSLQSAVFFDTTAGETYHIQVDGNTGATGDVTLNWGPTPEITAGVTFLNPEGASGTSAFINLPLTLSAPSTVPITVDWATFDFLSNPTIAIGGLDYTAVAPTQITFAPGVTELTVPIEVLGDDLVEPPAYLGEWGLVQLSNPSFATVDFGGVFGLGIFVIVDDD